MFDRKKSPLAKASEDKSSKNNEPSISVETIPDVFFGGNDPIIYTAKEKQKSSVVEVSTPAPTPAKPLAAKVPQPVLAQKSVTPQKKAISLPAVGSKKKLLVWICIGMVLLATAGTLLYYFFWVPTQIKKQNQQAVTTPPAPTLTLVSPPVVETPEPTTTTTAEPIPVVIPSSTSNTLIRSKATEALVFPSSLLGDTVDQDQDGLTDQEEELFGTDSGIADTDKDGYSDAQEVENLYNPKGFAPVKIIDSGIVKEYINPTLAYRVYYPANWEVGSVDPDNNQVLISGIDGDYVELRSVVKEAGQDFPAWLTKNAPDQYLTDLSRIQDRFNQTIWRRKDWLVAYAETADRVLVFIYHPRNEAGAMSYRHVGEMMIQSYRPGKTSTLLPEQAVLPVPPQAQ